MMFRSGEESTSSLFGRQLRRHGLLSAAEAAFVCLKANEVADGLYEAVVFKNNTITLRATSSAAAQELKMRKPQIIELIRNQLKWPADKQLAIKIVLH